MGSKFSKGSSRRSRTSRPSGIDSSSTYSYPTPQHPSYAQSPMNNHGSQTPRRVHKTIERKYTRIADNYQTLDQVTAALAQAGLESSNLIVGIDFTKSNEWTGAMSFNHRSLHHIGQGQNPYEQAISIIGQILSAFDEDNLIPCYGFGDGKHQRMIKTSSVSIRKRDSVKDLRRCLHDTEKSFLNFDLQVTRSVDTHHGQLSPQEKNTIDAIVKASEFPLSIVLVGVGDGPWDMMRGFDDNIPARAFDNFQFVNFTEIMSKTMNPSRKQAKFALSALMEIPSQYKATIELGLLGRRKGNTSERVPLPPPIYGPPNPYSGSTSLQHNVPTHSGYPKAVTPARDPYSSPLYDNQVCPICLGNPKDMAFGCGHQTCCECGEDLQLCPICRTAIKTRIRLY
ncbi:hypothetical protein V6N13_102282 [Hibiscus sabdariffa]